MISALCAEVTSSFAGFSLLQAPFSAPGCS